MLRAGQGEVGHAPDEKFDASSMRREPLRRKSNFFNQINLIWAVQSLLKKYFCFTETRLTSIFAVIPTGL